MNKQAANYVESVGDPMPRAWQTKKHNRRWLTVTLCAFIGFFIFFWYFNRTSIETATISLTEQNENNLITQSTIYLSYSQGGDFDFHENGEVPYKKAGSRWKRFWSPTYCRLFAVNYYAYDRMYSEDTLTWLNLKDYACPSKFNHVSWCKISDNKEYYRYSDLLFKAKLKSSMINPLTPFQHFPKKELLADNHMFIESNSSINVDTAFATSNIHLYARLFFDTTSNRLLQSGQYEYCPIPFFNISRYLRFTNRTCCNLYIQSIEFPCDSNCRFVLSFASPMCFDKLSIEPDETKPHELIYSSPDKIKALEKSGLYVYARDISANDQEMYNFLLATFIGFLFSYVIEFIKRLYTARKDEKFLKQNHG